MDDGPEAILDPNELNAVRRQAGRIHLQVALVTAVVTAVALLLG